MNDNAFLTHEQALELGKKIINTEAIPERLTKIIYQQFEAYSYLYSLIENKG